MLIKFAVKNFRGFANSIEWDLSQPSNYTWSKDVIKDGIIKNGIIYGPNGAGKTNFSLALFDIINHLTNLKAKIIDYQQNYVYVGNPKVGVQFEYTFKFGKQIIEYDMESSGLPVSSSAASWTRRRLRTVRKRSPIHPCMKEVISSRVTPRRSARVSIFSSASRYFLKSIHSPSPIPMVLCVGTAPKPLVYEECSRYR